MSAQFTPAPWKAVQNKTYANWEVWSNNQPICGVSMDHDKANAELISRAPDMYNTLADLVQMLDFEGHAYRPIIETARALLRTTKEE